MVWKLIKQTKKKDAAGNVKKRKRRKWILLLCHNNRDIRETVTFLDPGFHEMKHEKIDGGVKDRKKTWYNTMWVDKITNALEEVLGVEWMVVA